MENLPIGIRHKIYRKMSDKTLQKMALTCKSINKEIQIHVHARVIVDRLDFPSLIVPSNVSSYLKLIAFLLEDKLPKEMHYSPRRTRIYRIVSLRSRVVSALLMD